LQDYEKNYYYVGASKSLACTEKIPDNLVNQLKSSFDKDFTSTQEMYYAYFTQKVLNGAVLTDAVKEKLAKNLLALVKKDDSLQSLGYGFNLASELGASASSIIDRIEDAIAQADEVDGKLLQFEGGLSITSIIINGALRLTTANNKPLPLSAEQTKKFTSYFLARRSVTQAKGASLLLESLREIMKNPTISPIAIRIADNGQITPESPILQVRICDLLGEPLKEKPANVKVTITSKTDNKKAVDGENLVPAAADLSLYKIDLKAKKLPKGSYKVDVAAGNYKQSSLPIKVLGRVEIRRLEVSVSEADSQTPIKKATIAANQKFAEVYNLDHQQKLNLFFDLTDANTNQVVTVHQAFVRFSDDSGAEIVFVAEQDVAKNYKFEMDVGARASDFSGKSGAYSVDLVIGDASLVNSFVRNLGQINLKFSIESKKEQANSAPLRKPRSEIHHLFREPEKRPPRFVSDVFAGLCLAPILILFILWGRLGINVSNFSFSLSALGFHGGLGAIFSLFLCFWLKLDMFQTIQYLLGLSLFTFLCGNRVLRYIATKRIEKEKN
jgi:oligosaccharyltransferase complex subunit delta (ribophorin II)